MRGGSGARDRGGGRGRSRGRGPGAGGPGGHARPPLGLYVANNYAGTAHVVDPKTFRKLDRFNVIPDKRERQREIFTDPVALAYFLGIRAVVGEGHDQYVDDIFSSPDGRFVYISRPSFADVVGIDLRTKKIVWRVPVDGYRSDHMAISEDGTRLLVSPSTARKVHVIEPRVGKVVDEFPLRRLAAREQLLLRR